VLRPDDPRLCWCAPIDQAGQVLGSLCVMDPAPRQWQAQDRCSWNCWPNLVMTNWSRGATRPSWSRRQRLQACELQLHQLAQWMPTAIYQFRALPEGLGVFPFASQAFHDLFGLAPGGLRESADPLLNLLEPEDRLRMRSTVQASQISLSPWSMEFRCRLPDGRLEWFQGQFHPTHGARWLGAVAWVFRPHLRPPACRAGVARGRDALEVRARRSAAGVWDWNIASHVYYFSPQYRALYGYGEDEDLSRSMSMAGASRGPRRPAGRASAAFRRPEPLFRSEHRALCRDGQWKWILSRGLVVERDAEGRPVRMIGTHTDITERKLSDEDNFRRAYFDPLTGLPNRALLLARLFDWLQGRPAERSGAVIHVDLDGFKRLNHARGHGQGDVLLRSVARRLSESLDPQAVLARLGADEFVVLLPLPAGRACRRASRRWPWPRLARGPAAAAAAGRAEFSVTASLGVTVCPVSEGGEPRTPKTCCARPMRR
jgi:diguanylate cyclase (GGDEF)-like protein/PAS domain S-box-containing protein